MQIDGVDWAGLFAFNAFSSLFPIIILFVTIASFFVDRGGAERAIVAYWQRLIDANRDGLVAPGNADLLFPGQRLVLPPVESPR